MWWEEVGADRHFLLRWLVLRRGGEKYGTIARGGFDTKSTFVRGWILVTSVCWCKLFNEIDEIKHQGDNCRRRNIETARGVFKALVDGIYSKSARVSLTWGQVIFIHCTEEKEIIMV